MPGSIIAAEIYGIMLSGTMAFQMTAFAINIIASAIISKAFAPTVDNAGLNSAAANPGSRVQAGPAGDNKIPVVYGAAWVGGIVVDMSITTDNQQLYYVLALSEVTNTETGGTPDTITFGDVYFGGKKCMFDSVDQYKVTGLLDESTGVVNTAVAGKLEIYLYRNGSSSGANTTQTAIQVMQATGLTYTWDATKLMTNCAFAIVHMTYSQNANLTGLQATKFKLTNSRYRPGDCFNDYLTSSRYGAAIPVAGVDTASLTALNIYSDEAFPYTTYDSGTTTQTRFRFDGTLDTNQTIMNNMQLMASCCDCLIKYNEITGLWGVIVQKPAYLAVFNLTDSNMISSIQVTPTDLASSYNIAEVKFPDSTNQDAFNTATFNLAVINPTLLYPNEPVNKQSINLSLVNNNVRAQYLANRFLEAAREDLQIKVSITYVGLQLEAGDIVTVTSVNYGWAAKLFRIGQVVENFGDDGVISASLTLMEYNPAVYDDINITQFTPAPNTGIGSPLGFGTLTAPVVVNLQPTTTNPSFGVVVTAAASGITQYAEVYYSAYASPSSDAQRIFAGTTAVNPSGSPYTPGASMGTVTLSNIPNGDWYFAVRMVNSLGKSVFSGSSDVLRWRPTTFQYSGRYAVVAYGDDLSGTGLSASASGKSYYGIFNSDTPNFSTTATDYTWYAASPTFGTANSLLYTNRQGRKFSFATGPANYAAGTARFVPTTTSVYDPSIWSGLPAGANAIDLDARTGQLTETGTTNVGAGEIAIGNNANGKVVASLATLLDFGSGVQTLTGSPSTITIDVYGRVLGFLTPDGFYYTRYDAVATAGQTVFTPTARQANYIVGMDLVFQNGVLLDTTEYTESSTTVTLGVGAVIGDCITIISMRAVNQGITFTALHSTVSSVLLNLVTYSASTLPIQTIVAGDVHTFLNAGTPTTYTVAACNVVTREITYTTTVTGVSAGQNIYLYKTNGQSYRPFSRWGTTLTAATAFAPTTFAFNSGYEKLYLNGTSVNDQDYDLTGGAVTNFPATTTGNLTVIQFADNNLTTPAGNQTSTAVNAVSGQSTYLYNLDSNAFELYNNGTLQILTSDYTTGTSSYTLGTVPTTNLNILQQTTYNRTGAA
jgi:hypothetical protein